MTETPDQPAPDGALPVQAVLPDGIQEGLVVRPGDLLVVRVGASVPMSVVDEMAERIGAGMRGGRVLIVAAEQIGVVRA